MMHRKPCFVICLTSDLMWCSFSLNETPTVLMLCDSCSTMPMLTRLTSSWSDNNGSSHSASVWVCHVAESQHTQTLPCALMVCHRDGNSCQKGPLLLSRQTGTVHRITCFDMFSASGTSQNLEPASRWHCNIKSEAGVLKLQYERRIHHHYETCQPHISSQIIEQTGGNELCTLIGEWNRSKCRISEYI